VAECRSKTSVLMGLSSRLEFEILNREPERRGVDEKEKQLIASS